MFKRNCMNLCTAIGGEGGEGGLIVAMMMMNEEGTTPSLLCVLLQPTRTYINREK